MVKPIVLFRKLHKWLGLIVGIQVFFWVAGGLIMSFWPIEEIRGGHLVQPATSSVIEVAQLEALITTINKNNIAAKEISIKHHYPRAIAKVETTDDRVVWLNLSEGTILSPIKEMEATKIASQQYVGDGKIEQVRLISQRSSEYKKQLPAWRVDFNDQESTSFYIDALSGELSSVRTDRWRLFDFVWMLHIMDYEERENFHHPLIITAASLALLLVVSGIYLVLRTFNRRDLKWFNKLKP